MSVTRVPLSVVPALVATAFVSAWIAGTWFAIPAFDWSTPDVDRPDNVVTASLRVRGMKCRKTSQRLFPLLFDRQDDNRIEGYLRASLYPAPGEGRLEISFDPTKTDTAKIAQAISLDAQGMQTPFHVRIDLTADLGSPAALLHTVALALEHEDEELFGRCHAAGADPGVEFRALSRAWKDLFLEDLLPAGPVDAQGRVQIQGQSIGDRIPLEDLVPDMGAFVLVKRGADWLIQKAGWTKMVESAG